MDEKEYNEEKKEIEEVDEEIAMIGDFPIENKERAEKR